MHILLAFLYFAQLAFKKQTCLVLLLLMACLSVKNERYSMKKPHGLCYLLHIFSAVLLWPRIYTFWGHALTTLFCVIDFLYTFLLFHSFLLTGNWSGFRIWRFVVSWQAVTVLFNSWNYFLDCVCHCTTIANQILVLAPRLLGGERCEQSQGERRNTKSDINIGVMWNFPLLAGLGAAREQTVAQVFSVIPQ